MKNVIVGLYNMSFIYNIVNLFKPWFAVDSRALGLYRILLGILCLADILRRWDFIDIFYTGNSIIQVSTSLSSYKTFSLLNTFTLSWEVHMFFISGIIFSIMLILGYKTKLSQIMCAVILISIHNRAIMLENAGDFFMNVIGEIAYYKFEKIGNENATFGGFCLQAGVSPGFFIGNTSFSGTACTGLYRDDDQNFTLGFIAGGSVDIPLGEIILKKFPNVEIYNGLEIKDFKEYFESFEMRITGRSNLIQKKNGVTAWIGSGISFGYEF